MDIYFLGQTSVRLKGKKATIVIDCLNKKETGDAVLFTKKNILDSSSYEIGNFRVVIDGPGEYEVGNVGIVGIPINSILAYYIKIDGLTLLHLGTITKVLSDKDIEKLSNADIVFVRKEAVQLVTKLEPKIVVPIDFNEDTINLFLKEMGKEEIKPQTKLSITKEKLPSEMEVVWLS